LIFAILSQIFCLPKKRYKYGERKAPVIKRAVEEKTSNAFPASTIQQRPNGLLLVDEKAGFLLNSPK